jgi:hypothetical protein
MSSAISRISRVLFLAMFASGSIPDGSRLTWHLLEVLLKIIPDSRGRRPIRACHLTVATVGIGIGPFPMDRILVTGKGISSRPPK